MSMTFELHWRDFTDQLRSSVQPVIMLPKPPDSRFWTPVSSLLADPIELSLTRSGDFVRVPVFAYDVASGLKSALLAAGIEYGMRAMAAVRQRSDCTRQHVLLVIGNKVPTTEKGVQCFVGLTIMEPVNG